MTNLEVLFVFVAATLFIVAIVIAYIMGGINELEQQQKEAKKEFYLNMSIDSRIDSKLKEFQTKKKRK